MTNLNDIIKQKSLEYEASYYTHTKGHADPKNHFAAGASFATTDPSILQAILQPFGQWLLEKAWVVTKGVYELDGEKGQFTMEELIQKYFADNKQKEDGKDN